MSFRPPKARKARRQISPSSALASRPASRSTSPSKALSTSHHLVSPSAVQKQRRPRNSQGMFISSKEVLVSVPGHDFSQMPVPDRGRLPRAATSANIASGSTNYNRCDSEAATNTEFATDDPPAFDMDDIFITPQIVSENQNTMRKRETQWSRWMNEVIPLVLRPHLSLLRQSASLRSISRVKSVNCTCGKTSARHLKVVLVHFESKFFFQGYGCQCQ